MNTVHTIAFAPLPVMSHLQPMIGLAQTLADFGHKCVFIINEDIKQYLNDKCFAYECIGQRQGQDEERSKKLLREDILKKSSFEQIRPYAAIVTEIRLDYIQSIDNEYKRVIRVVKPDAIVMDRCIYCPSLVCAGVPWITLTSSNPLVILSDANLPPNGSGYAINSDKKLWKEFREEKKRAFEDLWVPFNKWMLSKGAQPLLDRTKIHNSSPYLNLYLYPEELDYKNEMSVKDKTFVSFDSMIGYNIENESKGFEIPKNIRKGSGKWVYISMGSVNSNEIILMKRFVSLLSNSKHRFIISKGQRGQEYELSDNMWGQNWLPQLQVLPIVDLVLTHGGNNTFNECLYFAKPMIVFPNNGDQFDNAQRLVDKGLGVRLHPYECTQTELFDAMDSLLNDSQLKAKYENISQRIKNSKSSQMCAKLIEDLIRDNKII